MKPGAETQVYRDLARKIPGFSRETVCEDVVRYAPDFPRHSRD